MVVKKLKSILRVFVFIVMVMPLLDAIKEYSESCILKKHNYVCLECVGNDYVASNPLVFIF